MTEGERIREVRKDLGLTLEVFSTKIGVTASTIGNVEKGRRNMSTQLRLSICREYNINENWLQTGEGEKFSSENQNEKLLNQLSKIITAGSADFRRRLISVLLQLPEEKWTVLEEIAEEIAKDAKYAAPARESEPP